MNALRDVTALLSRLPDGLVLGINRWILRQHRPEPLDGSPWCVSLAHRNPEPWPCSDFTAADRRIDEVLNRR